MDITYTGPTQVNKGDTITLSATLSTRAQRPCWLTAASARSRSRSRPATRTATRHVGRERHAPATSRSTTTLAHYKAIAAYAGDAAYVGGLADTVDFTVLHIPTKITYSGDTSGDYNDPVTLSAKLTDDSNGTSFASGDRFPARRSASRLGAESCSGVTDAGGVASCTVTPLDDPGSYSVGGQLRRRRAGLRAIEREHALHAQRRRRARLSYTGPLTVHYHDPVTVSATLTDPDGGAPIAGKTVTFTLGVGDTCSGTTDAGGHRVVLAHAASDRDEEPRRLVRRRRRTTSPSSETTSFSITPEETTMTYTGPTVILAGGSSATLTATLVEDGANDNDGDGGSAGPMPAETVTLSLGSQSCTGMTNVAGNVTCTHPVGDRAPRAADRRRALRRRRLLPGRQRQHDGDRVRLPEHAGCSRSATSPPPRPCRRPRRRSPGGATTGTCSTTSPVAPAPSAFKGFAGVVSLPTTTPAAFCSRQLDEHRRQQSRHRRATVPSYMGVIVSSSVTKSGNTVNGDYVKIVVVKTNPGYAPGPFNPGTGKIVATFCG